MNDEIKYLTLSDIENLTNVANPWGDANTIGNCSRPYTINDIADDLEVYDKDSLSKTIQKAIEGAFAEHNITAVPDIEKYKIKHR